MNKDLVLSEKEVVKAELSNQRNISRFLIDIKRLTKGLVLVSNILPVFTGLWLALYLTNISFTAYWDVFLVTLIGSTLVIAGALIINNWFDADIDAKMSRTKKRPTVTGRFSLNTVLMTGIGLSLLGFFFLLFTTFEAVIFAFIGWFTYVVLYTMWSKRRYTLNTVIGSVSGAVTPLIGWSAIEPDLHTVPVMLSVILFIWQMPHTYAIEIKYLKEYEEAGVKMLPVVHGISKTRRHMMVYIALLLPLSFTLMQLGPTFVITITLLNIIWLLLAVRGFFMNDDLKWARWNFLYSVNYITFLFLMTIVVTVA
ncbi:heme o synthase [Pseudalkalibacillus caeni]|uniref:Protoheme IX farnesyltransferase n=1 Tax=Exobacillus caeni TaxID=2574798 RepID=A0A5R9F2A4_9BACL|nr:heme o synthase [Pseudalkalibacillus caeni]TLS36456.1 protoheme IX farnesyltransferase [Pseudalkalibacillus caeni]